MARSAAKCSLCVGDPNRVTLSNCGHEAHKGDSRCDEVDTAVPITCAVIYQIW